MKYLLAALVLCLATARLGTSSEDAGPAAGAVPVAPGRNRRLVVMIMTHHRPGSVPSLLQQVLSLAEPRGHEVHVVVAQSCAAPVADNVQALRADLQQFLTPRRPALRSLVHVPVPYVRADASFSVNRLLHGSKRNSILNLLVGLDVAFTGDSAPLRWRHAVPQGEEFDVLEAVRAADAAHAHPGSVPGGDAASPSSAAAGGYDGAAELAEFRRAVARWRSVTTPGGVEHPAGPGDGRHGPERGPGPDAVVVLEDDVRLSADALDFFAFAHDMMATERGEAIVPPAAAPAALPGAVPSVAAESAAAARGLPAPLTDGLTHFATAFTLFRPSILVGSDDVAGVRRQREAGGTLQRVVDRLPGSPRSVFKTLAWTCDRAGYAALRVLLGSLVAYEPPAWRGQVQTLVSQAARIAASASKALAAGTHLRQPDSTVLDTHASLTASLAARVAALATGTAFRSGHPEFSRQREHVDAPGLGSAGQLGGVEAGAAGGAAGVGVGLGTGGGGGGGGAAGSHLPPASTWMCWWCNDYCYDHAIEWLLQRQPYLAPALPRVTQRAGSGMTSLLNDENEYYTGLPLLPGAGAAGSDGEPATAVNAPPPITGSAVDAATLALHPEAVPPADLAAAYGFALSEWPLYATTALLFRTPGASAVSPRLPDKAQEEDASSPVRRLEAAVQELQRGVAALAPKPAAAAAGAAQHALHGEQVAAMESQLLATQAALLELAELSRVEVFTLYAREPLLLFVALPLLLLVLSLLSHLFLPALRTGAVLTPTPTPGPVPGGIGSRGGGGGGVKSITHGLPAHGSAAAASGADGGSGPTSGGGSRLIARTKADAAAAAPSSSRRNVKSD